MNMKNILKLVGITFALLVNTAVQADITYDYIYSYKFDNGEIVSGSFTGSENGNLITNLSNITASLNGIEFTTNASGSLYAFSYVPDNLSPDLTSHTSGVIGPRAAWASGSAVASFDGTANNFLFIDSINPDGIFVNYFAIGSAFGEASSVAKGSDGHFVNEIFSPARWSVAQQTPVPVPAAVWLFVSGLLGLLGVNKRRHQTAI